jgi:hypothetical protein
MNKLVRVVLTRCVAEAPDFVTLLGSLVRAMETFGDQNDKDIAARIEAVIIRGKA